jgi:ribosomal protein S18 acetylase RimI-like enzyme
MNTRIVTPNDWKKFREIRLAGLRTDPQAFGGNLTEEAERKEPEWRRRLESPDRFFIAAEENDAFISMAGSKQVGDKSWILVAVHTLPQARGRKIAQKLIGEVINECRKRGADRMELMVNTDQKDAVHIYEKAGFKIIKTLQDEKMGDGNLHDEFVMEKSC